MEVTLDWYLIDQDGFHNENRPYIFKKLIEVGGLSPTFFIVMAKSIPELFHIEFLTSIATTLINTFGHWGVFMGMIIESACIPLPSEIIMLFGGFLTAQGTLNFWGVVWAGVLGNVVGSVPGSFI